MTRGRVLWAAAAALGLGFAAGSVSLAAIKVTGSTYDSVGVYYVGHADFSAGTLTVNAGSELSRTQGYIGYGSGSTGTATVTGVGSTWYTYGNLYVGYGGSGTLKVANGGLAYAETLYASLSDLRGNATISARGAVLDNDLVFDAPTHGFSQTFAFGSNGTLNLTLASTGSLGAGYKGTGTLRIVDGVTVASASGYLGYRPGSTGTATVSGAGSTWTNHGDLYIGRSGSGTLNIEAGGQVTQSTTYGYDDTYLGYNSGSTGTATVTGAGSQWTNNGSLYVGYGGNGTLTVAGGGQVSATTLYASESDLLGNGTISVQGAVLDADMVFDATHGTTPSLSFGTGGTLNLNVTSKGSLGAGYKGTGTLRIADGVSVTSASGYLGYHVGSTGTAVVTGVGSKWTGGLSIGKSGNGALTVEAGGEVVGGASIGINPGSTGTVTVTGAGSKWTGGFDYIGNSGSGTLNIEAGGQVGSGGWPYLGYASGATGRVTVTGAGSKWTTGVLEVGYNGDGTLNIESGGQVSSGRSYLGQRSGSTGMARVAGAGSKWTLNGTLEIGCDGSGTLIIEAGGQVNNTSSALASSFKSPSIGTVTVTGAGSKLTNSSQLYVGQGGNGTLNIEAGGQVSNVSEGWIGYGSGSTGTVTVTGLGSTWTNSTELYIGRNGNGTLNIEAGGQVSSGICFLGDKTGSTGTVTVTGAGSEWNAGSDFYVGYSGSGTLNVEAGGKVSSIYGYIGHSDGSTGTATITGAGSAWTNSGELYVGRGSTLHNSNSGALNVKAGGQVGNTTAYLGYNSGSTGTATVTGAGSTWTNSNELYVGYNGSGTLTVADGGHVSAKTLYASLSNLLGDGTITVTQGAVLDTDLVFDSTHGTSQTLAFGTGGTLNLNVGSSGVLGTGYKGTGTLRIADGVTLATASGYLGYCPGGNGTATVTGAGSTWTNSGDFYVGRGGGNKGALTVETGGHVANATGYVGCGSGSTGSSAGTVTVTGAGSTWTNSGDLYVGYNYGHGTLNVKAGGQVSNATGYLASTSSTGGTATVTGAGSTWTNSGDLYVGGPSNDFRWGTLKVSDGGKVTAKSTRVNRSSNIKLHVSGSDMLVLGDAATTGSITNAYDGNIYFYADAFLATGVYTPISEYAGRPMTWSGSGSYKACGGTWDNTAKTFTVTAPTLLTAGASDTVSTGERLLFTDPASGQSVGASFGTFIGGTTLSASPTGQNKLDALALTPGLVGSVFSAWDFDMNLTGGDGVLLSFDIGLGAKDLGVWYYYGNKWRTYTLDLMTYDSNGILSFTVNSLTDYAVTGTPEPATLALIAIGGLAVAFRRRRQAAR